MLARLLKAIGLFCINSFILLVSLIFSLVLLECGFRWWVFGLKAFDKEAMENNVPIAVSAFARASPHPEIYWALKPNLDVSWKLSRLTTNSFGLADQEYSQQKQDAVYRIAVLGDSYSMATGMDTEKSYHALLEKKINSLPSLKDRKSYEFINFSIGGFNLQRYNAVLQYQLPQWQPDAILVGYCGFNDHIKIDVNSQAVWKQSFIANGFWKSYIVDFIDLVKRDKKIGQPFSELLLVNSQNIIFIEQEFSKLRRNADAIKPGLPVLLAYLDNREHHPDNVRQIEALAAKYNMYFVDTTEAFKGTKLADYSLHILDSHPNAAANEIFASQLLQAITANGWFNVATH